MEVCVDRENKWEREVLMSLDGLCFLLSSWIFRESYFEVVMKRTCND
jgi:hypothetical protein